MGTLLPPKRRGARFEYTNWDTAVVICCVLASRRRVYGRHAAYPTNAKYSIVFLLDLLALLPASCCAPLGCRQGAPRDQRAVAGTVQPSRAPAGGSRGRGCGERSTTFCAGTGTVCREPACIDVQVAGWYEQRIQSRLKPRILPKKHRL